MAVLPLQVMAITLEVDLAAKEVVAMAVVATEQVVVEAGVAQEDPQEAMVVDKTVAMEEVKVAMEEEEEVAQDLAVATEVMAAVMALVEEMKGAMEVALLIAEAEVVATEEEEAVGLVEAAEETVVVTVVEDLEVSRLPKMD